MRPVSPPLRGAANATPFIDQPGDTAPLASILNVIPRGPSSDRGQFGTRPGLAKVFDTQLGNGTAIQALLSLNRASLVTGYTLGDCADVTTGTSIEAGPYSANAWLHDSVPRVVRPHYLDVTSRGGPVGNVVNAVAIATTNDFYAIASNFTDTVTGRTEARIQCIRASDGEVVWTVELPQSSPAATDPADRFVNHMAFSNEFLFVCTNQWVQVFKKADGTSPLAGGSPVRFDMIGHSSEAIACAVFDDGAGTYTPTNTRETLFVAFNGSRMSSAAGTAFPNTAGEGISAGDIAAQFRAGVMKFTIASQAAVTAGEILGAPPPVLVHTPWGQTLVSGVANNRTDPYFEDFHGYFRVSERSEGTPHGCQLTGIDLDRYGNVYCSRTNQGYGPNATNTDHQPDATRFGSATIFKVSAAGVMEWETDTFSIREIGAGGFYNDIPDGTNGDKPSILALSVNRAGTRIFAGGRRNAAGNCAFGIRGDDGAVLWGKDLLGSNGGPPPGTQYRVISETGVDVDMTDGNPVFAGTQNNNWAGATGHAHLWKLNAETGAVIWAFPNSSTSAGLGVSANGLSVVVTQGGRFVVGTSKV